jgi:hypothetical protein
MAKKRTGSEFVKQLMKQISGELTEEDVLIPEVAIDGHGEIWCWDPTTRMHKKIYRGIKAFIIQEEFDDAGRTLIYTHGGDMVCIEPEELLHTGYD